MFGGMLGDLDDDPFFGGQMRRMNQMMNSMLRDPFADMFGGGLFGPPPLMLQAPQSHHPVRHGRHGQVNHQDYGPGAIAPFGVFPNMRQMFDMSNAGNGAQFSSMQVMTMTSGPDGRPQIYQASSSTRQGPNGIRETKKTVADTRTGVKKMSIGHHIHDRAHIIEREQNVYSGEQEEHQEFVNLEEDEADHFNNEWQQKARGMRRNDAIAYGNDRQRYRTGHEGSSRNSEMLALPSSAPSQKNRLAPSPAARRTVTNLGNISKAAAIAEKNEGDERGKKRKSSDPVVVEIDSDSEEPSSKAARRSSTDVEEDGEGVSITEVVEPEKSEDEEDV